MTSSRYLLLLLAFTLVGGILGGCSKKRVVDPNAPAGTDDYDIEDIGGGIPIPQRMDGVNPDKDVDYQTLADQIVYFPFDSSLIDPSQREKLFTVMDWIENNPSGKIMLAGHSDIRGTLEYNRGLGERRAHAVRDYLIGLGAPASSLHTITYGEERPLNESASEMNHAQNRRVEIGIVKR